MMLVNPLEICFSMELNSDDFFDDFVGEAVLFFKRQSRQYFSVTVPQYTLFDPVLYACMQP